MHASLEQLIALRDGEPVVADVESHVNTCQNCMTGLRHLAGLSEQLSQLPDFKVPDGAWLKITARMQPISRKRFKQNTATVIVAVAAAASIMITVGLMLFRPASRQLPASQVVADTTTRSIAELVNQSRNLEDAVLSLNANADHMVISVGTAATVAALEDRIALVDYQLNSASVQAGGNPELAQLWQQRVDLLQSLAAVRYAQVTNDSI